SIEAKLVGAAETEDHVSKAADAVTFIMQHLRPRCREAVVFAKAVQACVVGKALRVIGETDEVVRDVKVSVDERQLTLPVAAESGARDDAEKTVSPVAVFHGVTAALCFQVVDVVYREGRANVHASVCIWDRHAVYEPRHLMATVDVQNVMRQVRTGHVTRNHADAAGARCSGR